MGNSTTSSQQIEMDNTESQSDRKVIPVNDQMLTLNNYGQDYVVEKNTAILTIIGIGTRVKVVENEGLVIIKTHEGHVTICTNLGDVRVEAGTSTTVDIRLNCAYESVVDKALDTTFNKDLVKINTESLVPQAGRYIVRPGILPPVYVKEGHMVKVAGVFPQADINTASCTICFSDFENNQQDACYLSCGTGIRHWFHFTCLKIWITKQINSCPICKRSIQLIERIADPSSNTQPLNLRDSQVGPLQQATTPPAYPQFGAAPIPHQPNQQQLTYSQPHSSPTANFPTYQQTHYPPSPQQMNYRSNPQLAYQPNAYPTIENATGSGNSQNDFTPPV